jgi:hypothetical protein
MIPQSGALSEPAKARILSISSRSAIILSLAATIALAASFYVYVPLAVDGGWYSYPAYSLSQGGDPSENLPDAAPRSTMPDRLTAEFPWENRSNLTNLPTAAWLKVLSPSWKSLKLLGAAQFIVLAALVGACIFWITRKRSLAALAVCLVASDTRVIQEAFSDARPDLTIAVVAAALVLCLVRAFETRSPRWGFLALVFAAVLPLLHVTSAMAIAFFLGFSSIYSLGLLRDPGARFELKLSLLLAAVLILVFAFKQSILDMLIPTHVASSVEIQYRHSIVFELKEIFSMGIAGKLAMERGRWSGYFFVGNTAHFLFIAMGLFWTAKVMRSRSGSAPTLIAKSLIAGVFSALLAMCLFDSHDMIPHALVIAVLAYLAVFAMLNTAMELGLIDSRGALCVCLVIIVLAASLNIFHTEKLFRIYGREGISSAMEEEVIARSIPARDAIKIIGPAEVWPLMVHCRRCKIIDDHRLAFYLNRAVVPPAQVPDVADAQYLLINKEYYEFGWGGVVAAWARQGLIVKVAQVGNCARTVECLEIYRLAVQKSAT